MGMWVALIGAGVSAYTNYASASNQADAATQASGVQVASSDRAAALQYAAAQDTLAFQKQQWESAQTMAQPWVQAGQGAVSKLSGLMGIGGVSSSGWTPQKAVASSGTSGIPASDPYPGYTPGSPQQIATERQAQRTTSETKTAPGPQVRTDPMPGLDPNTMDVTDPYDPSRPSSSYLTPEERAANRAAKAAAPTTTAQTMTTMRSPNGLVQEVPPEYVEYYRQLGATVVSNG